ncbi:phage portal protein [Streptosporangium canum]|uniref:phage portal protein n=1 Tax=Streptosporangium canum TaxID=324952 RepID=UPI0036A28D88
MSPLEWIVFLEGQLAKRQPEIEKHHRYYDADEQVLAFAQRKFREEFGQLFTGWRDNFCGIAVDSVTERMKIDGFRWGKEPDADEQAQEIWQKNNLDAEASQVHNDAMVAGESFLLVWADEDDQPIITPESSREVVVHRTPGSRRKLDAALKRYRDDWGGQHITLWTPDQVYTSTRGVVRGSRKWTDPVAEENPLGVVPIVPMVNKPRLHRDRNALWSDLKPIVPIQDAITKIVADAIVASEFAAYPQRILSGIELPEDENGNTIAPIQAAIDRMLLFEDENVKWGQFSAADLQNYCHLVDMLVMHLASIARIPPHYFMSQKGSSNSGESYQTKESGLGFKITERKLHMGEGWESAMRLAFKVLEDPRAEEMSAETIWADHEYTSEGQRIDALVKLNQGLGVPQRQLWEDAGYSPQQIARFEDMQEEEFQRKLEQQKAMAEAMPQPVGPPGAQSGNQATKPQRGNSGNDNRKNAA